jgi:hypothetical protein
MQSVEAGNAFRFDARSWCRESGINNSHAVKKMKQLKI